MRLEGRIKMGYYPTPLDVVDRIKSYALFPEEKASVLDPCCGEGLALKNFAEGHDAITYGIELDHSRADTAKENLNHVLRGSYEDARITNDVFSCLFLNPPYDWDASDGRSERKEKTFLKGTMNYLQPQGLLVYIIPQKRFSRDIAKLLAYRFENFNIFKFPDELHEYEQTVLFGTRKPEPATDTVQYERLESIPCRDLDDILYAPEPLYEIPGTKPVPLFISSVIDEGQLEKELENSHLWRKLNGHYGNGNGKGLARPPLPLHTGHLGLLLANGCLDGVVGNDGDRHVVRGKVEKQTYKQEEYKGDALIERETETYKVSLRILRKDGDIVTLI